MTDTPTESLFPYGISGKEASASLSELSSENFFDVLHRRIAGRQQLARIRSSAGAGVAIESLGGMVRNYRKATGLSQKELATRARVGRRFLSEFENGKKTVALEQVLAVCEALGLAISVAAVPTSPG